MRSIRHIIKNAPAAFVFTVLLLQAVSVLAQKNDATIVHVGDSLSKFYTYLFPSFEDATVKMRDGRSFVYKMNFNTVLCGMQFINSKGDTLVITNAEEIDSILLDSCSFIYDFKKGYFQILATSGKLNLAVYRQCTYQPVAYGAMGSNGSSVNVEMANSISNRQGTAPLTLNEDIYLLKHTNYVLYYLGGETEDVGKSTFSRIYKGDKKSFDKFIKANKIDFNKQGDLEKLFQFCTQSKN